LITTPSDLGAIPSLFGKPQTYAKFLWQELSFVYRGRVLILMPNGLGTYGGGASTAHEQRLLGNLTVGSGVDGMAASAVEAILKLAAAAGHKLDVKPVGVATPARSSSSSNSDRFVIAGVVAGAVILAIAGFSIRRRWQPRLFRGGRP
jgi:hypothetical protein